MALSKEEVAEARKQLLEQVKSLPEDKRAEGEKQVQEMSDEAISAMVEQQRGQGGGGQRVFRMMASGQIDTVRVQEDSNAVAVLEINPLSKGHMFVIPKDEVLQKEGMPESVVKFANDLAGKVQDRLKAKQVQVSVEQKFGEFILEIIPDYGEKMERKKMEQADLEKVRDEINKEVIKIEKKVEVIKKKKPAKKKEKPIKLGRRIP